MADVRVNGKRVPPLQPVSNMGELIKKLDAMAFKNSETLTSLKWNNKDIDVDKMELHKLAIEEDDTIEVRIENPMGLSFESLQAAMDMTDLLIQDLKQATVHIWKGKTDYTKSLEVLLKDCELFLTLAAKPVYLLEYCPESLHGEVRGALEELDKISSHVESATHLALTNRRKESCFVLMRYVAPCLERWAGLCASFAKFMGINEAGGAENILAPTSENIRTFEQKN